MSANNELEKKAEDLHLKGPGKISTSLKVPVETMEDLSLAYTPGVGHISKLISKDKGLVRKYTNIANTVAIVTDGTAVLGLGDIGPEAAMPVMEGKALLFKRFANIDAVPLCLNTKDPKEIIAIVKAIAPSFAGINLEDIKAPECFEIERVLQEELLIPIFHDDQHGTAVVVLAGLINALKVRNLARDSVRIMINGAGAAGIAVFDLLWNAGFTHITVCDSKGTLSPGRTDLNEEKKRVAEKTNPPGKTLFDALTGAHVFIGVSTGGVLNADHISMMEHDPIIFAMANPVPEIYPDEALRAGASIVATGRSDYPNQINNALAFPGLFRGALDKGVSRITEEHMVRAAEAIASLVEHPTPTEIIPNLFDERLVPAIKTIF
jgi:malate dehydrogenase (oxaloacetate-decarboxylating)